MMTASYFPAIGRGAILSARPNFGKPTIGFSPQRRRGRRDRRGRNGLYGSVLCVLCGLCVSAVIRSVRSALQAEGERDLFAGVAAEAEDDRVAGDDRGVAGKDADAAG